MKAISFRQLQRLSSQALKGYLADGEQVTVKIDQKPTFTLARFHLEGEEVSPLWQQTNGKSDSQTVESLSLQPVAVSLEEAITKYLKEVLEK